MTTRDASGGTVVVDVHAHLYPLPLIEAFESGAGDGIVEVERTDAGLRLMVRQRLFVELTPEYYDPLVRLEVMDAAGVDTEILSLPPPMLFWASADRGLELCRITNDALAAIAAAHPGRFVACCIVPLQAPALAVEELRRAVEQLGCKAVLFGTSINGVELDDRCLDPVYAETERLGVPIFNHPIIRGGLECLRDHRLDVSLGFALESTHAAARMVLSGVFDRHPGLRVCWSHLGGALPFLADRISYLQANATGVFPTITGTATEPFASYLRHFWYDTIVYSERNLAFGAAFAGADRLVFGTDTPFFTDSTGDLLDLVRTSPSFSDEERERVLHRNATELFGLG